MFIFVSVLNYILNRICFVVTKREDAFLSELAECQRLCIQLYIVRNKFDVVADIARNRYVLFVIRYFGESNS